MRRLLSLVWVMARREQAALLRGLALSVIVLAMGAALLGLSGWFIVASAAAGMSGIGILFNVFAPSAMVRFLALGRTVARYGERMLTHDATLRMLSQLRINLLRGVLFLPYRELERLRANTFLNRVTADIDTLDGALLRLTMPALAGCTVIVIASGALWFLVHPTVALVIGASYLLLPTLIFVIGQKIANQPARKTEAAMQAGRSRLIDLVAGREDLTVYGQLQAETKRTLSAFSRHSKARRHLDRTERRMGAALDLATAAITALTVALSASLVQSGEIGAAKATIAVFVSIALYEAVAPVRRALSEIGRMAQAAKRIFPLIDQEDKNPTCVDCPATAKLVIENVPPRRLADSNAGLSPAIDLEIGPGEMVALHGPSGSGKSTLLLLASGALRPANGRISWGGRPIQDWPRNTLENCVALVPQRHALIAGSIATNLRLAAPEASDEILWNALRVVRLADTIEHRCGLGTRLGFRGSGLSGGEARRLVLARALLRRPALLLLDEPTEGLDDATARIVLAGIRDALPDTAILIATHRTIETDMSDRRICLR